MKLSTAASFLAASSIPLTWAFEANVDKISSPENEEATVFLSNSKLRGRKTLTKENFLGDIDVYSGIDMPSDEEFSDTLHEEQPMLINEGNAGLVKCDPTSTDADIGILSCGEDHYCVASDESEYGGFCRPYFVEQSFRAFNYYESDCDYVRDDSICTSEGLGLDVDEYLYCYVCTASFESHCALNYYDGYEYTSCYLSLNPPTESPTAGPSPGPTPELRPEEPEDLQQKPGDPPEVEEKPPEEETGVVGEPQTAPEIEQDDRLVVEKTTSASAHITLDIDKQLNKPQRERAEKKICKALRTRI